MVWTAFGLPLLVNTSLLARMCVRELRSGGIGVEGKPVCGGMAWAATLFGTDLALALVQAVTGRQGGGAHLTRVEASVTACLVLDAMFIAIPLVKVQLDAAELDRAGRTCRRLRLLWPDLTTAVPEVVLRPGPEDRADATSRLMRITAPATAGSAGSGCPLTDYARQVAQAARAEVGVRAGRIAPGLVAGAREGFRRRTAATARSRPGVADRPRHRGVSAAASWAPRALLGSG
ncbi:hypothetical protein AB0M45_08165 [Nocardia sp. NPDC051787]|uniref:hypothetical protein n=1 Tax=Nocardia sp. NPDC051787 TaxID=3155415 RepID=UPI00343F8139